MSAKNASSDHDHIYLSLPWYVNDSLDSQERATVAAHIQNCAVCRKEVEFLTQIQSVTPQCDQIYQLPQAGFAATLRRIDQAESGLPRTTHWQSEFKDFLVSIGRFGPGGWAVAVALGMVILVSGLYLRSTMEVEDPVYRTVTSGDVASEDPLRFRVILAKDVSEAEARAFFEQPGTKLVLTTSDDGSYILEMKSEARPAAAAALLKALKSSSIVTSAELILE